MAEKVGAFELHPQLARDCIVLGDFALCRVLLMNDSNYPWVILVPRRANVRELHELQEAELGMFWRESMLLGRMLMSHFRGHKLNVAALGNQVPQLHVHHIVRYEHDRAWPKPVWGVAPTLAYTEMQLQEVRDSLLPLLVDLGMEA
ncbi:MAG: HIT domain-containing protein [Pseudomonadales bacterium]|nr:HIT domain-containing protein [Pseudomonadales bacterium]